MKNASRRPLTARPPSAKAKPESKLGEHEQRLLHCLRGSFPRGRGRRGAAVSARPGSSDGPSVETASGNHRAPRRGR